MRRRMAVMIAAPLFAVVAAPALAQNSESAPAAAAPMKSKPKPKTPAGGTVTVKVTNWREADLVELQVVESGSANWKKVLGALKAGQWTWAKVPNSRIVAWICAGNTPTASRRMCPISISVRTRQSTWSTDAPEAAQARSGARRARLDNCQGEQGCFPQSRPAPQRKLGWGNDRRESGRQGRTAGLPQPHPRALRVARTALTSQRGPQRRGIVMRPDQRQRLLFQANLLRFRVFGLTRARTPARAIGVKKQKIGK